MSTPRLTEQQYAEVVAGRKSSRNHARIAQAEPKKRKRVAGQGRQFDEALRAGRISRTAQRKRAKKHPLAGLLTELALLGLPEPELEATFHPGRKWRFDASWNEAILSYEPNRAGYVPAWNQQLRLGQWHQVMSFKIALEYNGVHGSHNAGHASVKQLMRDYEKTTEAQLLGWLVIVCTAESVRTGQAREWVIRAFEQRGFTVTR